MAENPDVNTLKRRGRRRLVGAIALVLTAVIVLPMVFDQEPKPSAPPVSVRIPGEEESRFAPKTTPKPPALAVTPGKPQEAPKAAAPRSEPPRSPDPVAKQPAKPVANAEVKATDAERARAEAALANAEFVIQVAALAEIEKVKELTEKLAQAKLPYYTESVAIAAGRVTRIRVGPFASRDAAERALEKLKDLGLKPGKITSRSG
jgi:DedD protein